MGWGPVSWDPEAGVEMGTLPRPLSPAAEPHRPAPGGRGISGLQAPNPLALSLPAPAAPASEHPSRLGVSTNPFCGDLGVRQALTPAAPPLPPRDHLSSPRASLEVLSRGGSSVCRSRFPLLIERHWEHRRGTPILLALMRLCCLGSPLPRPRRLCPKGRKPVPLQTHVGGMCPDAASWLLNWAERPFRGWVKVSGPSFLGPNHPQLLSCPQLLDSASSAPC